MFDARMRTMLAQWLVSTVSSVFDQTCFIRLATNLVPRAHVSSGQRRDTELWNNPFLESKILRLPVSRRMRALV